VHADEPPPPASGFTFKQGSLYSDIPSDKDALGVESDAQALARFILHPQTDPPLTVGIHGPWGKGKSSFMKLVENALIDKVLHDEGLWSRGELTELRGDINDLDRKIEQDLNASATEIEALRRRQRESKAIYDERRMRLAERLLLTVRFNALQPRAR